MKTLFITALLALMTAGLIISMDYLLGTASGTLVWKVIYPFRVMEPAEYVILFFIFLYFLVRAVRSFVKKKKGKTASGS